MIKNSIALLLLAATMQSQAQIFNSGFENNNGTPLSAYTKINADGLTVANYAEIQAFNTEAWMQFYDGYDDKIAFSTSMYSPPGKANDWLITPAITLPADGKPTLYWKAKSYDTTYADGYRVMISTTDTQMTSFTELLSVPNEQAYDFNARTLDLSTYKGQTVYLAYVNNTTDGLYLALNDLYISNSENCVMPDKSGLSVSGLSENSFNLNWTPTPGITTYDVGLTDFSTSVTSYGLQTTTSKSFSTLTSGKRYQAFLRNADCGSGWAGPYSIWTATKLPYAYNFEPTTENFGEYDSDGWKSNSWVMGSLSGASQDGVGYAFNGTSKSSTKNDWLYSYPIKLSVGEEVTITYYAAMSTATASPGMLKVSVASAPDQASHLQELSTQVVTGNAYKKYTTQFSTTTPGVYYFGFGNVTAPVAASGSLRLDNINFSSSILAIAENNGLSEIKIFPNPVKDILTISGAGKIQKTVVYAMDGKLVKAQLHNLEQIDFSGIPKGIYLVKIYCEKGVVTKKIIK